MNKLKDILDKAYDTGKLPRGWTLALFRTFETVYYELLKYGTSETISPEIKNTLLKCGMTCRENGIGWVIYNPGVINKTS